MIIIWLFWITGIQSLFLERGVKIDTEISITVGDPIFKKKFNKYRIGI